MHKTSSCDSYVHSRSFRYKVLHRTWHVIGRACDFTQLANYYPTPALLRFSVCFLTCTGHQAQRILQPTHNGGRDVTRPHRAVARIQGQDARPQRVRATRVQLLCLVGCIKSRLHMPHVLKIGSPLFACLIPLPLRTSTCSKLTKSRVSRAQGCWLGLG